MNTLEIKNQWPNSQSLSSQLFFNNFDVNGTPCIPAWYRHDMILVKVVSNQVQKAELELKSYIMKN